MLTFTISDRRQIKHFVSLKLIDKVYAEIEQYAGEFLNNEGTGKMTPWT